MQIYKKTRFPRFPRHPLFSYLYTTMRRIFLLPLLLSLLLRPATSPEIALDGGVLANVSKMELTAVLPAPEKATGTAVIVAPGGAFIDLEMEKEGFAIARMLADRGIAAFVLKYRTRPMGRTQEEVENNIRAIVTRIFSPDRDPSWALISRRGGGPEARAVRTAWKDGLRAVRRVRRDAAKYGIDPDRIGIMGFSAGAVLTLCVAMDHGRRSRPDFAVPVYGGWVDPIVVPRDACPLYLVYPENDIFPREMTYTIYEAWRAAGVPAHFATIPGAGHGFGPGIPGTPSASWLPSFFPFLTQTGLLPN